MNNFDLVKTAFAENDLATLKKILQQLYVEITSFSNPEIVDQILESKNDYKNLQLETWKDQMLLLLY